MGRSSEKEINKQTSLQELWWEKQLEGLGGLTQQKQQQRSTSAKDMRTHLNVREGGRSGGTRRSSEQRKDVRKNTRKGRLYKKKRECFFPLKMVEDEK